MSDSRSKRSHKKVNYAAFSVEDDDDFADSTPPAKKAKLSNKQGIKDKPSRKENPNKENSLQRKAVNNAQEKKSKSRKAPDERSFDRELQAALELSLRESQDSETDTEFNDDSAQPDVCNKERVIQIDTHRERLDVNTADNDKPPVPSDVNNDSTSDLTDHSVTPAIVKPPILQPVNSPGNHTVDSGDEIEILESTEEKSSRRRATTTKKSVIIDEDSDFELDAEDDDFKESDDSDDDYSGSDYDDDFSKKKTKGKATKGKGKKQSTPKPKSAATPKNTSKAASTSKNTAKTKSAPLKKSTPITSSVSRPALSSPTSRSVGGGLPKWTPPASIGNTSKSPSSVVSVKSPSSGLRLGLSRNQRVKPLHSGCKVQH